MSTSVEACSDNNENPQDASPNPSQSSVFATMKKIIQNITVEPLIICWLFPFLLTYAAIENMQLEKACRALVTEDYTFSKDVCKLFVRKDEYGINCTLILDNTTIYNGVKIDEIKTRYEDLYSSIEDKLPKVYKFLCEAEEQVQAKLSFINSIRNPISSIGPLVIILFAGPWSDKKQLRVPCMMVPFLGEAIGYMTLLIAAIFINGPVEFPAYAYRLLPSLTGAENLMVMGIFSYLSAVSTEENRTLRFGMFQILMAIVPIFAQSMSPTLVKRFEYTELFGSLIPVHIIGFLYAIYYLKEPSKKGDKKEEAAYDNPGMSMEMSSRTDINSTNNANEVTLSTEMKPKNACLEFFDPQLAMHCVNSLIKAREFGLRKIIVLLMLMHFMGNGIAQGESQNVLLYSRIKLGWDTETLVYHNVYAIVLSMLGTSFAIGVLSKLLKVTDISLILLSVSLSIACRVIYMIAQGTVLFFAGTAVDFMSSIKLLATRSIISKIVPSEDLSTMFAVMGLFEALSGFVFPFIYPTLYNFLVKSKTYDVSLMFGLTIVLMAVGLVVYIYVWNLLKSKEKAERAQSDDTKL